VLFAYLIFISLFVCFFVCCLLCFTTELFRFRPHHQNTGGFFITVFERVPRKSKPRPGPCTEAEHADPPPPALDKKARKKLRAMYPFAARFVSLPSSTSGLLQRELELSKSFCSRLFVRLDQAQAPRRIHLMSTSLGNLLMQDGGAKLLEDGKVFLLPVRKFPQKSSNNNKKF